MKANEIAQKSLTFMFAAGSTLAIGFLSFAGMFVLTSSIPWCIAAFVLAAAYEGQVNVEGIYSALRRMFDQNFLKQHILRQFLEDQLAEQEKKTNDAPEGEATREINPFLKEYQTQTQYLDGLERIEHPTKEQEKKIAHTKKQIEKMELFFLNQYENDPEKSKKLTKMEQAAQDLLSHHKSRLSKEIRRKSWLIRLSWLFAIGGGISSGLAAFGAIQAGIAAFSVLSVIPGGILIALAACAAIGYTLLLYQSISDMVQAYGGKWKKYFEQRPDETKITHILRCTGTVMMVCLAVIATVATAGTWWYAAKEGALLLNLGDKAASFLRSASVALMALPVFIFSASNSIASVDNISRSSYKELVVSTINSIKKVWLEENVLQFINPFRMVEKIISFTSRTVLFLGHVISMGLMSDGFDAIPAPICTAANSTSEALADLNYLPNEKKEHDHDSIVLQVVFFPITLTVTILKLFSVLWDRPFSGSFKKSWDRIFHSHEPIHAEPNEPMVSEDWKKQQVIETCHAIHQRLSQSSPDKISAVDRIETAVRSEDHVDQRMLRKKAEPLAVNRFSLWKKSMTRSQTEMDNALNEMYRNCAAPSA